MTAGPARVKRRRLSPAKSRRDAEKFERGQALMHEKFAGAFKRLAK